MRDAGSSRNLAPNAVLARVRGAVRLDEVAGDVGDQTHVELCVAVCADAVDHALLVPDQQDVAAVLVRPGRAPVPRCRVAVNHGVAVWMSARVAEAMGPHDP